ncbi:MAG: hypothetical protein IAG10_13785 [Planctomycetaceae bacterium]|nr:hypothetical protein [Planctomycetaceae bacterium]
MFANEVMLMPYYIAALNIEHAYYELAGEYEPFEGLCFVDTLDLAEKRQLTLFGEENTARVTRQKNAPITVIIGNPPYNVGQISENDNNKNRKYSVIDDRIKQTYGKDSKATLNTKLYDPYVKFFRWAMDRLNGRDGIVCFVTNNSFVDQFAFDGMRKHLLKDFSRLYHLHLEGNVRQNPKLSGTAYNVFGIQVGVGITIAVRLQQHKTPRLSFHRIDKSLRREAKLSWLADRTSLCGVKWKRLTPDDRHTWLVPKNADEFAGFPALGDKKTKGDAADTSNVIFKLFSLGLATNRDEWAYDFARDGVASKMKRLVTNYNYEVFRLTQEDSLPKNIDDFVNNEPQFIKWTDRLKESLLARKTIKFDPLKRRSALYRPFTREWLYFDSLLNQRRYQQHRFFPTASAEKENLSICATGVAAERPFATLISNVIPDLNFFGPGTVPQWFPFYTYSEDGSERRENITDQALEQFHGKYKSKKISKWDIFYYVYGLLHHPGYREKFADNLKRELPRIPFAPDFKAFTSAGRELAQLHLEYEQSEEYQFEWLEAPGVPLSYHVEKMKLTKDKTAVIVNPSLTLAGIPPEAFEYRLGNRSALEWIIDQYQITEDKRSGIRSDPNRADDPEYIVRLVGQVVHVSVETVRIVNSLPKI